MNIHIVLRKIFIGLIITIVPTKIFSMESIEQSLKNLQLSPSLLNDIDTLKTNFKDFIPQVKLFNNQLISKDFKSLSAILSKKTLNIIPIINKIQTILPQLKIFIENGINLKTVSSLPLPENLQKNIEHAIKELQTHIYLIDDINSYLEEAKQYANIPMYKNKIKHAIEKLSNTSEFEYVQNIIKNIENSDVFINAKNFIENININSINNGIVAISKMIQGQEVDSNSLVFIAKTTKILRQIPEHLLVLIRDHITIINTINNSLMTNKILDQLPPEITNILSLLETNATNTLNIIKQTNMNLDSFLQKAKEQFLSNM